MRRAAVRALELLAEKSLQVAATINPDRYYLVDSRGVLGTYPSYQSAYDARTNLGGRIYTESEWRRRNS